ncbi:MAG: hypothetical protein CW338_06655 [Clostridiales bacterium]|nr:hypothetical protein [Clostridiales bacterium]
MKCDQFEEMLDRCFDEKSGLSAEMKEHMAECASCRELYSLKRSLPLLDANEDEQFPAGVSLALEKAIYGEDTETMNNEQSSRKSRMPWVKWASVAAAVLVLIGGTLITRDNTAGSSVKSAGNTAVYTTSANGASTKRASSAPAAAESAAAGIAVYDTGDSVPQVQMAGAPVPEVPAETFEECEEDCAEPVEEGGSAQEAKIIRSAGFTVKTSSFDEDVERLKALAGDFGGRIEYISTSGDESAGDSRFAYITLRIPSARLDDFLAGAGEVGNRTDYWESSQDISENYYDTYSRLETQKAKLARLQEMLPQAQDVSDIIEINSAIDDAQYWVDYYQGRINGYDSQVSYSTVSVTVQEVKFEETEEASFGQRIGAGIRNSLSEGAGFLGDMLVFIISILPWLAIAGVIAAVTVIIVKKSKKKQKTEEPAE